MLSLGAGFSCIGVAKQLAKHGVHLLIGRNSDQQFQLLLYQVPSFLQRCGRAIAGVLREDENPRVLTGDVTSIGAKAHAVTMADGAGCEGRILLISTGAKMNFSGTQGADEFSSPRYSVHDVLLPSS